MDTIVQKFKDLPAAQDADPTSASVPDATTPSVPVASRSDRLFGREKSVYDLLGGGKGADIILWREWKISLAILSVVTIVYVVFEWKGYHVLSVFATAALIVFAALFVWSNVAALVKRSPLDFALPEVSEATALHYASVLREQVNLVAGTLREVVLGKDIKLFIQVELLLWILTRIGQWADFLTLTYLSVLLILLVPVLYERHEDKVDRSLQQGYEQTRKLHGKLQEQVQNRIPQLANRLKKAE